MTKTIEFAPTTPKKCLFTLRHDGQLIKKYEFNPASEKLQVQVAKDVGVDHVTVLGWLDGIQRDPRTFEIKTETTGFQVYYRPIKSPRLAPTGYLNAYAFCDSLTADRETIVEWDGDDLGCLDVDYHTGGLPSREWLETTVLTSLLPRPYVWHLSPRGFHAFYPATSGLTGPEVAALAAMKYRTIDGTAGVELKRQLRGPGAAKLHKFEGYQSINSFVTDFLGVGENTIDPTSYLESKGLEIGHRYNHSYCPIEPTENTDNRDPVVVSEAGIYCHRCAGLGRQRGRNRAGYVPFSVLCGSPSSGVLGQLVRNKTHWGHAQHVLEAYLDLTGEVARKSYSAACKLYHNEEVEGLFNPITDPLVRIDGKWGTINEGYTFPKGIEPLLKALPAATDPAKICLLSQPVLDLTDFGYPSIQVLRGCKMSTRNFGTDRLVVAAPAKWLKEYGSVFYPRYVLPVSRMSKEQARATIETVLPGVDWRYIELLLVARGCNEARLGLPQHLLVSGGSGTGKTSHVQLAAGILGDEVTPIPADASLEKFRSSVRDGSERGSFLSLDEIVKDSMRLNPRLTPEQVFEPILNFDSESLSHKMYVGPTQLGHLGVCVWTDTRFHEVLHDYTQIARRVHTYKLTRRLDWTTSLTAHGLSKIKLIRTVSQEHADACNAIMSYVIDEFFQCPLTFEQLAVQMGISTLEKSEDFYDLSERRLEFFKLVCAAPPLEPDDAKRYPGRGYKLIVRNDDLNPLWEAWSYFSDGGKNWADAKRLHEKPFHDILGVSDPVEVDTLRHQGVRMVVRFRQGPFKNPTRVNEEIK